MLPPAYQSASNVAQQAHLDAVEAAIEGLDSRLEKLAASAIAKIKASGYKSSVAKYETRKLMRKLSGHLSQTVAEQILAGVQHADHIAAIGRAYAISERAIVRPVKNPVPAALFAKIKQRQIPTFEQAIAREKYTSLKKPGAVMRAYGAPAGKQPIKRQTPGERALAKERKKGVLKPTKDISLSKRLHKGMAHQTKEVNKAVSRVIRNGEALDKAGKTLVNQIRVRGRGALGELGAGQKLPQILEDLKTAGRRVVRASGLSDKQRASALRDWDKQFNKVKRHAARVADQRGGYRELLQILDKGKARRIDHALSRWLDEKQRSNAERIVRTETAAAGRLREYDKTKRQQHWIKEVIWTLARAERASFVRSRKPAKSGKHRGRRCVCETLAGRRFPIEVMADYPRMGHPHCLCYWVKVVDRRAMLAAPISQEELDWYEGLAA
jgi:hypothetical protein